MKKIERPYQYSKELTEICQPLFEKTPVNFFSICRLNRKIERGKGKYNAYMTDPKWNEYYLKNHYQPPINNFLDNTLAVSDYELWTYSNIFSENESMEKLYKDCCAFDYTNGMVITNKQENFDEIFIFASSFSDGVE